MAVGGEGGYEKEVSCGKSPPQALPLVFFPPPAKGHQNFPEEEDLGDVQLSSVLSSRGNAHAALPEFM